MDKNWLLDFSCDGGFDWFTWKSINLVCGINEWGECRGIDTKRFKITLINNGTGSPDFGYEK